MNLGQPLEGLVGVYDRFFQVLAAGNRRQIGYDAVFFAALDAEWYVRGEQNIVLSYQIATLSRTACRNLIEYVPDGKRLCLAELVELGIRSIHEGSLPPAKLEDRTLLVLVSHNFVAEWSVLFDRGESHVTKRLVRIRKSPVTLKEPIKVHLSDHRRVDVRFYDTMLLAPASHRSLKALSKLLGAGFQKKDIDQYLKENMNLFLQRDPKEYEEYALRDSEACLRLFLVLEKSLNRLAFRGMRSPKLFMTLAAAGVEGFLQTDKHFRTKYLAPLRAEKWEDAYRIIKQAYHGGRGESYFIGCTDDHPETRDKVWVDIDFCGCYPTMMALCPKIDVNAAPILLRRTYALDPERAARLAGLGISPETIREIRAALGASTRDFEAYLNRTSLNQRGREVRVIGIARANLIRDALVVFDDRLIKRWQRFSDLPSARGQSVLDRCLIPGFARVKFTFPSTVQYPCLPVRHFRYGLLFPRSGETVATASEIMLALQMGAKIKAITSVELPVVLEPALDGQSRWVSVEREIENPDLPETDEGGLMPSRFFFSHLRMILRERERYKACSKDDLESQVLERLLKEFSNSFYGKFAQAINPRKTYSPAKGRMDNLVPSLVSEPCVAALITGAARAAFGSILFTVESFNLGKPPASQVTVVSGTTDGLLLGLPCPANYSCVDEYYPLEKDEDGVLLPTFTEPPVRKVLTQFGCGELLPLFLDHQPLRQLRLARRELLDQDDAAYIEVKHMADVVWSIKNRGQVGLLRNKERHATVLAKFGLKPPISDIVRKRYGPNPTAEELIKAINESGRLLGTGRIEKATVESDWIIEMMKTSQESDVIDTYDFYSLTPFKEILKSEGTKDLTQTKKKRKFNADYDWKRKIRRVEGRITPYTDPHENVAEMLLYRETMQAIRKRGLPATLERVYHRVDVRERTSRFRGGEPVSLSRMFLRGVLQGHLSAEETWGPYDACAERLNELFRKLNVQGKVWSANDFKNAGAKLSKNAQKLTGEVYRSRWEPGVMMPNLLLRAVLSGLCEIFRVEPSEAQRLLFADSSGAEPEDRSGDKLILDVVRAIQHAPRMGIEPFRQLYLDGRLPNREGLLTVFPPPILTLAEVRQCEAGGFSPGQHRPAKFLRAKQLFYRLGISGDEGVRCARVLAPTSPEGAKKPPENPAHDRCLRQFVIALMDPDLRGGESPAVGAIFEGLKRYGLTKSMFARARTQKIAPRSLRNRPENRAQIHQMARALKLDPGPFLVALLEEVGG